MDFGTTLVALTAVLVGGTFIILPVAMLALRFGIRPLVEAWTQARNAPLADERLIMMERRLSLVEEQLQTVERENARLIEQAEFQMHLSGPREHTSRGRGL